MKKTLAIYFFDPKPMGYPFDKKQYFEIYQGIIREIEKQGMRVCIMRGRGYRGNGRFTKGWRFVNV